MANKQSRTVTALGHAQPVIIADRDGYQGQNGRNEQGQHEHRGHEANLTVLPSRLLPGGDSSTRQRASAATLRHRRRYFLAHHHYRFEDSATSRTVKLNELGRFVVPHRCILQ